ncbi:hypothetical protein EOM89_03940 [Candidatus Falkowbacteria bacterium]|nr:hypothetical protein [Candidatus Falkowbacteria bacterium]
MARAPRAAVRPPGPPAAAPAPTAPSPAAATETAFVFGRELFRREQVWAWNPDQEPNGHAVIWGGSGTGKSRLLRGIIHHFARAGKHLHVIDQHGDLGVAGENLLAFGTLTPTYGINPFEFELNDNGGPRRHIHTMVDMLRRTYLSSMRAAQEVVLRQLLLDAYRVVGIDPDDPQQWLTTAPEALPSVETLQALLRHLLLEVDQGGGGSGFLHELERVEKEILKARAQLTTLPDAPASDPAALAQRQALEQALAAAGEQARGALDAHLATLSQGPPPGPGAAPAAARPFALERVDLALYRRKNAARALETLSLYIDGLASHGVFAPRPPPVRAGLNRYDLSRLPDKPRIFFIDVLLNKIFRAARQRGEYRQLPNRRRGERIDTLVVLDEAQAMLPVNPAERQSPAFILNRIAAEARKYGVGLIVVTQSPAIFPKQVFSNVCLKVGFRTNQNDVPSAMKFLGVRDNALFNHTRKDGVAMVAGSDAEFRSVVIDWEAIDAEPATPP